MPPSWAHDKESPEEKEGASYAHVDDAEKGVCRQEWPLRPQVAITKLITSSSSILSPITSPIHEGITPSSSVPVLSLSAVSLPPPAVPPPPPTAGRKPERVTQDAGSDTKQQQPEIRPKTELKCSKWNLFRLWFNTYRKFWTFVTLLNLAGIIMTALGRFPYAENHLGAMVLGNLLCAILMRNELFLRFLYTVAIYGLRGVSSAAHLRWLASLGQRSDETCSGRLYASKLLSHPSCSMSAASTRGAHCQAQRESPQPSIKHMWYDCC
jgi:hypothetical protein